MARSDMVRMVCSFKVVSNKPLSLLQSRKLPDYGTPRLHIVASAIGCIAYCTFGINSEVQHPFIAAFLPQQGVLWRGCSFWKIGGDRKNHSPSWSHVIRSPRRIKKQSQPYV